MKKDSCIYVMVIVLGVLGELLTLDLVVPLTPLPASQTLFLY